MHHVADSNSLGRIFGASTPESERELLAHALHVCSDQAINHPSYPDERVFKHSWQRSVNRMAHVFDGDSVPQDDTVLEIGGIAWLLRVHPNQVQVFPKSLKEIIQIEFHLAARTQTRMIRVRLRVRETAAPRVPNHDAVGLLSQSVDLLQTRFDQSCYRRRGSSCKSCCPR